MTGTTGQRGGPRRGAPTQTPTLANAVGSTEKDRGQSRAVCPLCGTRPSRGRHRRLLAGKASARTRCVVADHDAASARSSGSHNGRARCGSRAGDWPAEPSAVQPGPASASRRDDRTGEQQHHRAAASMAPRPTATSWSTARRCPTCGWRGRSMSSRTSSAQQGSSDDYVRLSGYATAAVVKKLRRSTRGCPLPRPAAHKYRRLLRQRRHRSLSRTTSSRPALATVPARGTRSAEQRCLHSDPLGGHSRETRPRVTAGPRPSLPFRDGSPSAPSSPTHRMTQMISYATHPISSTPGSSARWITTCPELTIHGRPRTVHRTRPKKSSSSATAAKRPDEHRDREHYDTIIAAAFARDAPRRPRRRRSHHRVRTRRARGLAAILARRSQQAGLVMTASWPANTEAGGSRARPTSRPL